MTDNTTIQQWALVELFGHQRIAGRITEQTLGGCAFVRVDVPQVGKIPPFTKFFGQGAIYAISFVTEEIAQAAAASFRQQPVSVYDIPELRQRSLGLVEPDVLNSAQDDANEALFGPKSSS